MSLAGIPFEDYDAIRFLIESARRAQPGLMLSAVDRFEAVRICELLVGVPLALELAGAWVRLLTLPEIRSELEGNLDFLTGSVSGLPERHQGLRAVFEHSWALLEPGAQALLIRLAVFRGGFERHVALEVAGAGNLELLALLDQCLLRRIQGRQNRFELHELIRQYALEKLEASATEAAKARRNHFEQFLSLAQTAKQYLHGNDQAIWFERLELEHDNLSAALQWALETKEAELGLRLAGALCLFWEVRGHGREGRGWLEQLLTLPEAHLTSAARVKALVNIGIFATQMGDYTIAREQLEAALKLYQSEHDQLGQAVALRSLAELERSLGELEQAAKHLETSIALLEKLQAPIELAKALATLGIVEAYQGNPETARKHFENSLGIFETLQDRRSIANQLANIANTLPNTVDGRSLIERSLTIKRELGDQNGIAISIFNLGNLVAQLNDLKNAQAYMCEGMEISWKLGHRRQTAHMLISIADVDLELGNPIRTLELTPTHKTFLKPHDSKLRV
jgi:tetratricopeptide (TPR) repeat protein